MNRLEAGYVCDYDECDLIFSTKPQFEAHRDKKHTQWRMRCFWKDCHFVSENKYTFETHLNTHKGIYGCSRKGCRPFTAVSQRDMKIHKIEKHKKTECSLCMKKFRGLERLRNHKRTVHQMSNENSDNPIEQNVIKSENAGIGGKD